jgi:hypothetical protein
MSIELALIPIAIAVAGTIAARRKRAQESPNMFALETRMKDPSMLQAALADYGCQSVMQGDKVDLDVEGARIVFEPNAGGVFEAVFIGNVHPESARQFVLDLHDMYTQQVQQQVYQNLLARASSYGLMLEDEQVEADNSILLTFVVQE